jgi:hypothetical protein
MNLPLELGPGDFLPVHLELANTMREESEQILRELQEANTQADRGGVTASLERLMAFTEKWPSQLLFATFGEFCQEMISKAQHDNLNQSDLSSLECLSQGCISQMRELGLLSGPFTLPSSDVAGINLIPAQTEKS